MSWIADRYGSRRGLWRHLRHQAEWRLRIKQWPDPPLVKVDRLVFVCKGNICRSALGGVVADARGFPAVSYGMDTHPGKTADPVMLRVAAELGYDLSGHRTTPLRCYENRPGDLVVVFEPVQLEILQSGTGQRWDIVLLGNWAKPKVAHIDDPFGGTENFYKRIAERVAGAAGRLVGGIGRTHE